MRLLKRPLYFFIICGLAIGGIIGLVINSKTVIGQLHSWKLLPREERLTEFYFTDHKQLPDSFQSGERQKIRFAIKNLEKQKVDYHYKITAKAEKKQWLLARGQIAVPTGAAQKITKKIILPRTKQRIALQVDIQYETTEPGDNVTKKQKQSIHYWMKERKTG